VSQRCQSGDTESCIVAAELLWDVSDDDEATTACARGDAGEEAACQRGDGMFCAMRAEGLLEGTRTTPRDEAAGRKLLERACELGLKVQGCLAR
jgi:hypothetical protein